jgi:hypothetical protein
LLKITIAGPPSSGKSWAASLAKAVMTEIMGATVTMSGEGMTEHAIAQRTFQLMAGAIRQPLRGQEVHIEQIRTRRTDGERAEAIKATGPSLEMQLLSMADKLVELEHYLPEGPRRDAFAGAYKSISEAIDHIQKAKTL